MPGSKIVLVGLVDDWKLWRAKEVVEALAEKEGGEAVDLDFQALFEPEWEAWRDAKTQALGGGAIAHTKSPLVTLNDAYVGGLDELTGFANGELEGALGEPDALEDAPYKKVAADAMLEAMRATGKMYCFQDIKVGDAKPRHLVFELATGICPRTCENFKTLCEGNYKDPDTGKALAYKGSPFHRIVQDGWVQGGDILTGRGDTGNSTHGAAFPDESFALKFDAPGVLAMANAGAHSNASQFFITLAPLPWLDCKAVAFGRVIKGLPALRVFNRLETRNERPVDSITIGGCGEVDLATGYGI